MPSSQLRELFTPYFADLPDPRIDRTKQHALLDILILALCATLGGANGWADIERFGKAKLDFFRQFLELPNGVPAHDTFGRVFARLDPVTLASCIQKWLAAFRDALDRELVAIDGKTLRGSFDTAAGQNPLHLVSAWASAARLVLGQVAGAAHSNEITAIPLLLELLDRHAWRDWHSIGMVYAERQVGDGEVGVATRFFISSLAPKVKAFARAVRGHWGIENRLHWSLDVTFAEDQSRVRKDHGPANLGMLRRLAWSILQQDTSSKDSCGPTAHRELFSDNASQTFRLPEPTLHRELR
jgi:predicted transposase YbfD/YdcC